MLDFFTVDKAYGDYLRLLDSRIPNLAYSSHDKFVCGIVLLIGEHHYYAPISHNTKPFSTSFLIRDVSDESKVLSSIRFSFMFPALPEHVSRMDFKRIAAIDCNYADLLTKEHRYCTANEAKIRKFASRVYKQATTPGNSLKKVCCDFKLLEQEYLKFA